MLRRKEFVLATEIPLRPEKPRKNVVEPRQKPFSENVLQKVDLDFMATSRHDVRRGRRSCSYDATAAPITARRTPTTPWWKAFAPRPGHDSGSSPTWESSTMTRNAAGNAPSCFTIDREKIVSSASSRT